MYRNKDSWSLILKVTLIINQFKFFLNILENCGVARYHSDGFHPNVFNFKDVSESDILWHYLKTKSVHHMHKIMMYEDLMNQYQHIKEELKKIKRNNEDKGCKKTPAAWLKLSCSCSIDIRVIRCLSYSHKGAFNNLCHQKLTIFDNHGCVQ